MARLKAANDALVASAAVSAQVAASRHNDRSHRSPAACLSLFLAAGGDPGPRPRARFSQ